MNSNHYKNIINHYVNEGKEINFKEYKQEKLREKEQDFKKQRQKKMMNKILKRNIEDKEDKQINPDKEL